ncbi:histidine kinase N-terminal domain-containing protein [Neobacillus sp. 179-C4.2 HS]|jgi:signal transduction histidine kinase|uniref:histidine kinase n=1 Tax=Neobacillus driksii TaxID=3035913 RepID=A0ABV4YWC0_9BACI|nr:histidine kinase N-terminal domain-containing protein [Neobacillus sp. 179.-C4.2 HS]MDP5196555.1 histidine kinase N-terminal domain-containing protein [Neobacillus sp. 179.-C4.2 HS]
MLSKLHMDLIDFFNKNKEELLREWENSIVISNGDPYKEKIGLNGIAIFNIVLTMHTMTEEELLETIQKYALEISEERALANINIGDFVYNVNLGRSVLYSYLSKSGLVWADLQESINKINFCFDKFLYYAVTHYTEAKNKIIEEKTMFIDSTHQDRLTLLGQMTSSFIHEFRNPMTSIQGFIQLLKADHPEMKYLDIISSELDQLNFRISQFLLLSKKELIGKEKEQFNQNKLIDEVLNFLYPSILDGKVKIKKDIVDEITLFGYADEMRQVFINIIFNAIDVLNHHRVPNPTIEIKCTIDNNSHVVLSISNNGPMIPAELSKTIFEPFFTTKKLGTGLGLFVCKEIIEKHKGELTCLSTPDLTVFTIKLPLAASPI